MVITIYEGYDNSYVMLKSHNEEFQKTYGNKLKIFTSNIYRELESIASWGNNELGEEVLFEIG